ncbi:MAG: 50S ribosomal protein L10 [Nitrospirota bacterium]
MKRAEKEQVINELRANFVKAKAVIFTNYRGLTVAELSELRRSLRDGNFEYRIIKNTLAKIASEGTPLFGVKESFRGPVGIAISYSDPIITVKKILDYSRKNDKLKVDGAVIEGAFCAPEELKAVAEIPSRQVLLSMLAGGLQAPISKFACALNATLSKFVHALEALKQKK